MLALYSFAFQHPIPVTNLVTFSWASISTSQTEDQLDNIYDSDFSQGSLSPSSPPSNPSLITLLPDEMFNFPKIPANMLWHCSIGEGTCSYVINLCTPSATNLRSISTIVPQDEAIYLLNKQWKINDKRLYMIFCEMVNAHREDHLKELDIKHVRQSDGHNAVSNYFDYAFCTPVLNNCYHSELL
jgi:hypothetical protein